MRCDNSRFADLDEILKDDHIREENIKSREEKDDILGEGRHIHEENDSIREENNPINIWKNIRLNYPYYKD